MPIQCRGCGTELDPAAEKCGLCQRPRGREEIFEGYAALKEDERLRRRRPWIIAGRILAFGALAGLAFYFVRSRHLTLADAAALSRTVRERAGDVYRGMTAEEPLAPPAAEPPAQRPAARTVPADVSAAAPVAVSSSRAESPRWSRPAPWVVRGRVYELIDLKPAAGLSLEFSDKTGGRSYRAKTDAVGKFSIELPRVEEGGYAVSISAKGRRREFVEDNQEPRLSEHARARRDEEAAEMLRLGVLHVPVLPPESGDETRYDVALLPLR